MKEILPTHSSGAFRSRILFTIGIVSCLSGAVWASEQQARSYAIPGHGELELKVPEEWKDSVKRPSHDLPPTLIFTPRSDKTFKLLVTVFWNAKKDPQFNKPETIAELVTVLGNRQLSTAQETKLDIAEITMPQRGPIGYIYTLTDKAPAPGSFEYMTQGIFAAGDFQLSFTLLSHEIKPAAMRATLKALATAKGTKKGSRGRKAESGIH